MPVQISLPIFLFYFSFFFDLQEIYVFVYFRNHSSVSHSKLYLVSMLPVSTLVNFSSNIFTLFPEIPGYNSELVWPFRPSSSLPPSFPHHSQPPMPQDSPVPRTCNTFMFPGLCMLLLLPGVPGFSFTPAFPNPALMLSLGEAPQSLAKKGHHGHTITMAFAICCQSW